VGTDPVLSTITTRQFGELRVLAVRLGGPLAPILVEAQQINQINDATRSLTVRVAIGTPLLALAFGVLTWFVVGRAMKPVESTRLAVAGIVDLESGERVENPRTGDELESLVSTMNLLLDRLQVSVEREQRFISDASHELRSPIAAVRAILESGDPSVAGSWDSKLAALGALQRLQDLADQLLVLDRTAESRREILRQPVDVDEWVFAVAEQLRGTTNLTIDTTSVSGGQVLATEVDVIRIVDNLMANAARYAQRTVKLSLVEQDGWVRFEVTDDGPGIPAEKQMEIFERFTRLDTDRGQNTGGAGLGLAIVRDLIDRYRGSVEVTSQNGSGATFVVMLPSSRASA
jgi:signal transduction histidine kinase